MMEEIITPVLLGADLNCYSLARAFHEAFGVSSHAFGRYPLGITKYSKIVRFTAIPDLDTPEVLLSTLLDFAKKHKGERLFLIGCTDAYADLIIELAEKLRPYYFFRCPEKALAEKLISKDRFYEMCELYGIDYPKTKVITATDDDALFDSLPFPYPIIIKPSSSIHYWQHPFDGMKKVYTAENAEKAKEIARTIFSSGYPDSLILQDFIPGDDSEMYVLTAYSNGNAKVKMMCMGHVLLEEHTPKGIGNHTAILTEYHADVMEKIKAFLEKVGYVGFSNFDIKFDTRDGKFKAFEINLRQGRSNHYITNAGMNLASLLVSDAKGTLPEQTVFVKKESFWHTVPRKIIYSYIKDEATMQTVKRLVKEKNCGSALLYPYDLRINPMRRAFVTIHNHRYHRKYKLYP